MNYFKRILWLAAWSVWVWLGFGLYRELPREPGRVLCRLPPGSAEEFQGFMYGRPSFVTKEFDASVASTLFRRRGSLTGEVELSVQAASPPFDSWEQSVWAWQGYVVGYEKPRFNSGVIPKPIESTYELSSGEVHLYSLRTGESRRLAKLGTLGSLHPKRSWGIFSRVDPLRPNEEIVVLIELETGRRLLEFTNSRGVVARQHGWTPFFVGDDIALVVFDGDSPARIELRSPTTGEIVTRLPEFRNCLTASDDGKLAGYQDLRKPYQLIVEDGVSGKRILTDELPADHAFHHYQPSFSPDGRTILSPGTGALIDIISKKRLWEASHHEHATVVVPPNGFEVVENWASGWGAGLPNVKTYAVRSLIDGAFIHRTWRPTHHPINDDYTQIYMDGVIRQLPPRVSYSLLLLCQAILALPLVILWAVLRWRRKKCTDPAIST